MDIRVRVLASGSSGNSILVQVDSRAILIDAGLPARLLSQHLAQHGVTSENLDAIFVTHEHSDHIVGVPGIAKAFKALVVSNSATFAGAKFSAKTMSHHLETGTTTDIGPLEVTSFAIPHDAADPVGYSITCDGWTMCVCTDAGFDSPELDRYIAGADLAIVEANHDVDTLQRSTAYPAYLKQRILGKTGHLSNEQSANLVSRAFMQSPKQRRWLWLAHLSKENNSPSLALNHLTKRVAPPQPSQNVFVEVAAHHIPSLRWESRRQFEQLRLF